MDPPGFLKLLMQNKLAETLLIGVLRTGDFRHSRENRATVLCQFANKKIHKLTSTLTAFGTRQSAEGSSQCRSSTADNCSVKGCKLATASYRVLSEFSQPERSPT
eukprot:1450367-Rhodomonas_salina.1